MKLRLSSLELLLAVVSTLLLACCIGLSVVSWLSLKPEGAVKPGMLSGRMVITHGAVYSDELKNSSSLQFKSLAFNVQNLVSEAFGLSELRLDFQSCRILHFSQGSVVVTFDIWFSQLIEVQEVEHQLWAGLQVAGNTGLVIDRNSIHITEKPDETTAAPTTITPTTITPTTITPTTITPTTITPTTITPTTITPTTGTCPPLQTSCADGSVCVRIDQLCDGVPDCPDASDEDAARCATACDGQFVLSGPSGFFSTSDVSETYNSSSFCRWILRVERGLSVQINFLRFETEENIDTLKLYEGVGADKLLTAELSGSTPPGTMWLLTDQSTVEFISDDVNNLSGFTASYSAANLSQLSNEQKLTCTFEQGMCFWRQQYDDDGDWIRTRGATFPPLSGPSGDHTLNDSSGFYIVTPLSPGQWLKSFRIYSLPLTPPTPPAACLSFWYHMLGEDIYRLRVLLSQPDVTVLFQRDGNYGDRWNYGQVTLNLTTESTVVFEALKKGGMRNDIALDDITLTSDPCGPAPPEPTNVPPPTTPPPIPADCGGPFDLWEPNSTFSSPNYPQSYGNEAKCLWTLHAAEGQNLQLHFLDFDVEATYDVVEVRDGAGPHSNLLVHHCQCANFTSGVGLGSPAACAVGQFQCQTGSCIHGNDQCDGNADCPDASDEAYCVVLPSNSSSALQYKQVSSLLTVCSDTWTSQLSDFTCQYLGYRSGETTLLPARPQDSPFTSFNITNGALQTSLSDSCASEEVISLSCDNQPCGVRNVTNAPRETNQSAESKPGDVMRETDQSAERKPAKGDIRVVGGANAEKGAWPWIVSLQWRGRQVCGASLIGQDWLLTAAHCVYGKNVHLQWWEALLGLHAQSNSGAADVQTRRVDRIVIHPQYNRQTKQADIAMMHLQQPISFTEVVQPVCLPADGQDFTAGTRCWIAGWGRTEEQGSLLDVLQEAELPLLSQSECEDQLPEYSITASMVCAGLPEGGVDACQGDSGGPLVCLEDGYWTLIGVTSFGKGCGRPLKPGVYARVSAFSTWISQTRRNQTKPDQYLLNTPVPPRPPTVPPKYTWIAQTRPVPPKYTWISKTRPVPPKYTWISQTRRNPPQYPLNTPGSPRQDQYPLNTPGSPRPDQYPLNTPGSPRPDAVPPKYTWISQTRPVPPKYTWISQTRPDQYLLKTPVPPRPSTLPPKYTWISQTRRKPPRPPQPPQYPLNTPGSPRPDAVPPKYTWISQTRPVPPKYTWISQTRPDQTNQTKPDQYLLNTPVPPRHPTVPPKYTWIAQTRPVPPKYTWISQTKPDQYLLKTPVPPRPPTVPPKYTWISQTRHIPPKYTWISQTRPDQYLLKTPVPPRPPTVPPKYTLTSQTRRSTP
ncbi:enteropeptidase [Perca flavescens]|uniref:enteropeptidase n=1 Tax=Perca flavescens TaxID=8167 RepID=UPI00106EA20C|nr:enteropeptidase [Perca flavescens]